MITRIKYNPKEIEHKILYSILYRKPKRADIYWFVHVDVVDDPYTTEYSVQTIVPNEISAQIENPQIGGCRGSIGFAG